MRLPFFSSSSSTSRASGKTETKQRRDALDEAEEDDARRWKKTATGKKAIKKAERKHEAKKRAWTQEQERRRLDALARWESVLRSEPADAAASATINSRSVAAGPATVTSANGRLERTRSSHSRSRRFLDIDRLDELLDTSSSDGDGDHGDDHDVADEVSETTTEDDVEALRGGGNAVVAGPTFQLGSSQAAQMSQVAAMRELPMLESCATPQAPASFFVDMLLLGGGGSSKPRRNHHHHHHQPQHRSAHRRHDNENDNEQEEDEAAARRRRRREKDKLQRATRSCPSGSRKRPS